MSLPSLAPTASALRATAHALVSTLFGGAPPPSPSLSFAGSGAASLADFESNEWEDDGDAENDEGLAAGGLVGSLLRRGVTGTSRARSGLEELAAAIWLAVPKRKKSYSRKRQRQLNPRYAATNVQNFYPCPKCDKGLLKLRHHVCPCDQENANVCGVRKVRKKPETRSSRRYSLLHAEYLRPPHPPPRPPPPHRAMLTQIDYNNAPPT
jgi:ribosomal protein L32